MAASAQPGNDIYQLRAESTVANLHEVLQVAFGWEDMHLNRFEIRGREYGVYRDGGPLFATDARRARLGDLKLRRLERFVYESTSATGGSMTSASKRNTSKSNDGVSTKAGVNSTTKSCSELARPRERGFALSRSRARRVPLTALGVGRGSPPRVAPLVGLAGTGGCGAIDGAAWTGRHRDACRGNCTPVRYSRGPAASASPSPGIGALPAS